MEFILTDAGRQRVYVQSDNFKFKYFVFGKEIRTTANTKTWTTLPKQTMKVDIDVNVLDNQKHKYELSATIDIALNTGMDTEHVHTLGIIIGDAKGSDDTNDTLFLVHVSPSPLFSQETYQEKLYFSILLSLEGAVFNQPTLEKIATPDYPALLSSKFNEYLPKVNVIADMTTSVPPDKQRYCVANYKITSDLSDKIKLLSNELKEISTWCAYKDHPPFPQFIGPAWYNTAKEMFTFKNNNNIVSNITYGRLILHDNELVLMARKYKVLKGYVNSLSSLLTQSPNSNNTLTLGDNTQNADNYSIASLLSSNWTKIYIYLMIQPQYPPHSSDYNVWLNISQTSPVENESQIKQDRNKIYQAIEENKTIRLTQCLGSFTREGKTWSHSTFVPSPSFADDKLQIDPNKARYHRVKLYNVCNIEFVPAANRIIVVDFQFHNVKTKDNNDIIYEVLNRSNNSALMEIHNYLNTNEQTHLVLQITYDINKNMRVAKLT